MRQFRGESRHVCGSVGLEIVLKRKENFTRTGTASGTWMALPAGREAGQRRGRRAQGPEPAEAHFWRTSEFFTEPFPSSVSTHSGPTLALGSPPAQATRRQRPPTRGPFPQGRAAAWPVVSVETPRPASFLNAELPRRQPRESRLWDHSPLSSLALGSVLRISCSGSLSIFWRTRRGCLHFLSEGFWFH